MVSVSYSVSFELEHAFIDNFFAETAMDIKDHAPSKKVTVIHSRPNLMSRFHPKLHEIVMEKFKANGIETVLGQRVTIPEEGFPNDGSEFAISLADGTEVKTELAVGFVCYHG